MTMYYNSTTGELTNVAPWGNHYYDDEIKAELFSEWSEVADDYTPTIILTTDEKITALDEEYESQFDALAQAYSTALMAGDTTTATEVQEDYATLKAEYTAALEAIS